jgi:hypothetical protein
MEQMKTVTFALTLDEANVIFKALGKMPFEQVYELIGKMHGQANQQLAGKDSMTSFNVNSNYGKAGDGN